MDIWECTEKDGEKVYKCPMCRGYSYDRLNYCPTCGEHMKTENGKIKIEVPDKRPLTTKKFARMRDEKRYFKGVKNEKTNGDCNLDDILFWTNWMQRNVR